jgi:hypothetical protein
MFEINYDLYITIPPLFFQPHHHIHRLLFQGRRFLSTFVGDLITAFPLLVSNFIDV